MLWSLTIIFVALNFGFVPVDDKQRDKIMELNHGGLGDRKCPVPLRPKRKFSIPVTLSMPPNFNEHAAFRRRFSNVGDAVSRKLSTTIGWV